MTDNHTIAHTIAHEVFESLWSARMSSRGHVAFDSRGDTVVTLVGLQTGRVSVLSVRTHDALGGHVVVLHVAGSSYWSGRGVVGYAGAEVQTILVEHRPSSAASTQRTYRYVVLSGASPATSNAAEREATTRSSLDRLAGASS
jgi:hypothetical protein